MLLKANKMICKEIQSQASFNFKTTYLILIVTVKIITSDYDIFIL